MKADPHLVSSEDSTSAWIFFLRESNDCQHLDREIPPHLMYYLFYLALNVVLEQIN